MYPTDMNMPGIKGKRIPGKPGRFDPSMPLHMTTRRAAKGGPNNGSPSVNGSTGDEEGRRGSLDDQRPDTSRSNGSQFSAKSRRLSEVSLPLATPDMTVNGIHSSNEKETDPDKPKPFSPIRQSPSPSRKRKRSSSATPPQPTTLHQSATGFDDRFERFDVSLDYDNDIDAAEIVPFDDLSDRDVPRSQVSSVSDEAVHGDDALAPPSVDVTPAVSEPVSPATSESGSQEESPFAKPLEQAFANVAQATQDDIADVAEDMDEADDIEEQPSPDGADEEGRPRRNRFGGRRRARHPIPMVEAAMQRQAQLKSAYRAIARVQKAALAEIAQRTVDDLETNPEAHVDAAEYEDVSYGLADAYKGRKNRLNAQSALNKSQLKEHMEAELQVRRNACAQTLEDLQEAQLDLLEHKMVEIARAAQLNGLDVGYETEDEDDVVPKPKGMGYRWKRSSALDSPYDSRSRAALETEHAAADNERRFKMGKLLAELPDEDRPYVNSGFTIMHPARREMAKEKREGIRSMQTLAAAADELERVSQIPIIRNEDAVGLQILGALASRPSIAMPPAIPGRSEPGAESYMREGSSRPPPLQLDTNYGPSRIPVEMSPRTTQAMGDRFEHSMPPPVTPRQAPTSILPSPETMRLDPMMPSPTMNAHRMDHFRQQPRSADGRSESGNGPFSPWRNGRFDQLQHTPRGHRRVESNPAPFQIEERRNENPLWREYSRNQARVPERRPSAHSDHRPTFTFPNRPPLREDTRPDSDGRHQGIQDIQPEIKDESPTHSQLLSRPPQWQGPSSQPGFASSRRYSETSPPSARPQPSSDVPRSPRSSNASTTRSIHDYHPSAQRDDNLHHSKHKGIKPPFPGHKTTKAERGGIPRRQWGKDRLKRSLGKSGSAGSPISGPASYAGSPIESRPSQSPWQSLAPSIAQHSFNAVPPPASYQTPSSYAPPRPPPPPPSHFPPSQQGHDYYQHRNSFPPPPPASWGQPSPSPLYAVPQHPPPPGVPPEQYSRFAPPAPPGFPPQPPPPPTSHSGSYGHQFGGTPLAPANPSYTHVPGFRAAQQPLPAFAQQAQQSQQSNGPRRRTQSDSSHFHQKFHTWHPPNGRRQ